MPRTTGFYVYVHKDSAGRPFYVGKGAGDRAWSKDRDSNWHRYVDGHLHGAYSVEVVKDGLSEEDALRLEDELIEQHGDHLVNWVNPGRRFDYPAIQRFHELRDANRQFVADTRPLESTNLEEAVRRYREAIARIAEYESIVTERGLVAELTEHLRWGAPLFIDRLTLCLFKLRRWSELEADARAYFSQYPDALVTKPAERVTRRVAKAREALGKPPLSGPEDLAGGSEMASLVLRVMRQRTRS